MKFGCNYSNELLDLIKENPEICDYIKIGAFGETKDLLEKAFSYKPLLIHGFGWFERGGMDSCECMDFELMNKLLVKYRCRFLGMHLMAYERDARSDLSLHMIEIFNEINSKLKIPLILENIDYCTNYNYETTIKETVRPEFIKKIVDETKLGLLLDTSHALVSAYQLNIDIYEYLERLPLEKVKEIHFSGIYKDENYGFMDKHLVMGELDYELAKYLANSKRVNSLEVVTLEYGTIEKANKKSIRKQLKCLKEIFS